MHYQTMFVNWSYQPVSLAMGSHLGYLGLHISDGMLLDSQLKDTCSMWLLMRCDHGSSGYLTKQLSNFCDIVFRGFVITNNVQ